MPAQRGSGPGRFRQSPWRLRFGVRWLAVCLVLLAVLVPLRALAEDLAPAAYFRLKQQAEAHFAAARFAEAAPLYARLVAHYPEDGDQRLRLARSLFESGAAEQALPVVVEALEMGFGPEAPTAYRLAQAMAMSGENAQALAWLQRALDAAFEDQSEIKRDPAFAGLTAGPRFQALAGMAPEGVTARAARWGADLDFLLAEARRLHAAPHAPAQGDGFAGAVEALKTRVATLSDVQVVLEIQRLLAILGDGHTVMDFGSASDFGLEVLPLRLYAFADGLFVVDAAPDYRDLIGARVVTLAGRDPASLTEALAPFISRDNEQGLARSAPQMMTLTSLLSHLGLAEADGPVTVKLEKAPGEDAPGEEAAGARRNVDVAPRVWGAADAPSWRRRLAAPAGTGAGAPLWLQRPQENYWSQDLPALDALYVQVNRVRNRADQSIADFVKVLKNQLSAGGRRHLIFDLRHNGGGNNRLIRPLIRLAVFHEESAAAHRVFVITSRHTFSAAQNLVTRLEQATKAVSWAS